MRYVLYDAINSMTSRPGPGPGAKLENRKGNSDMDLNQENKDTKAIEGQEGEKEDDGVRHVYRVSYASKPQVAIPKFVKKGIRQVRKGERIKWQGGWRSYTKIIRARNEEEARVMLEEAARKERYPGERSMHAGYRMLVEIKKWEVLL